MKTTLKCGTPKQNISKFLVSIIKIKANFINLNVKVFEIFIFL